MNRQETFEARSKGRTDYGTTRTSPPNTAGRARYGSLLNSTNINDKATAQLYLRKFYGINWDGNLTSEATAKMKAAGVDDDTIRLILGFAAHQNAA